MNCLPPCHCLPPTVAPYHAVCQPPNLVEKAFKEAAGEKGYMDAADLATFTQTWQGDNTATEEKVTADMIKFITWVEKTNSSRHLRQLGLNHRSHSSRGSRGSRSSRSSKSLRHDLLAEAEREPPVFTLPIFLKFLLHPIYNEYRAPPSRTVTEDMKAPLSDYYIFASHNTYLTGNQLTSKCGTLPIVKALESGCRVIELDCWNGLNEKINVTHGNTLTKAVGFEECVRAIKASAFVASEYPVIVTIENHLSQENQKRAAKMLKDILGNDMFVPSPNDRPPVSFQSPEDLKRKIIISDKPPGDPVVSQVKEEPEFAENMVKSTFMRSNSSDSSSGEESHSLRGGKKTQRRQNQVAEIRRLSPGSYDDSDGQDHEPNDPEFEELLYIHCQKPSEMVEQQKKGGPLIAGQHAIMANLSESQLDDLIEGHPNSLIKFSKTNLGRMYPFGLRFNSSNADPMDAWSHGIQVAAINMQGNDRGVWISKAFFSKNGGCGYVKKPDILLPGSNLDHDSLTKLPPKLELKVTVLMGTDWHRNYDVFKKPDYFVKVAVHGMYGDAVKKHTKVIRRSREPHWDKEFTFLIRVPELAILRFEVKEHDTFFRDDMVGQSCVPVTELRQGIRAVKLQSKKGLHRDSKLLCYFSMQPL